MAWKLPRDGGGFNAGFDRSGDEQLWKAKTVSPTDPDVYQKGALWGSNLTHGGRNVNEAVEDYQDWSRKWGSEYKDENERLEKYKYKFGHDEDTIRRGFYRNYPSSYDLDFTIDDLNEQWYLPKEAPENYEWFNQGGIASLENRPGYRWAGEVNLGDYSNLETGIRGRRLKADPVHGYIWGGGEGPFGSDQTKWDFYGKEWTGKDMYGQDMSVGYPSVGWQGQGTTGSLARGYLNERDIKGGDPGFSRRGVDEEGYIEIMGPDGKLRKVKPMNEGGAVGLEPGIGSLMGYAKGGMVTKVRVPKGQSKWMKKFMNNMRDK